MTTTKTLRGRVRRPDAAAREASAEAARFRDELYACRTVRGDELFEPADTVLCAVRPALEVTLPPGHPARARRRVRRPQPGPDRHPRTSRRRRRSGCSATSTAGPRPLHRSSPAVPVRPGAGDGHHTLDTDPGHGQTRPDRRYPLRSPPRGSAIPSNSPSPQTRRRRASPTPPTQPTPATTPPAWPGALQDLTAEPAGRIRGNRRMRLPKPAHTYPKSGRPPEHAPQPRSAKPSDTARARRHHLITATAHDGKAVTQTRDRAHPGRPTAPPGRTIKANSTRPKATSTRPQAGHLPKDRTAPAVAVAVLQDRRDNADTGQAWQTFLRHPGPEHTFRPSTQTPGRTRPRLREPEAADRRTRPVITRAANCPRLRPPATCRTPGQKPTAPHQLTPAQSGGCFENPRQHIPCPARTPKPHPTRDGPPGTPDRHQAPRYNTATTIRHERTPTTPKNKLARDTGTESQRRRGDLRPGTAAHRIRPASQAPVSPAAPLHTRPLQQEPPSRQPAAQPPPDGTEQPFRPDTNATRPDLREAPPGDPPRPGPAGPGRAGPGRGGTRRDEAGRGGAGRGGAVQQGTVRMPGAFPTGHPRNGPAPHSAATLQPALMRQRTQPALMRQRPRPA
ncbi:hypothetical protein SCATT_57850 [Streptantibioticus cattleyicolor NRRL 8057 = DSM 46488]|uniref:Uncharacterized protein n=1 Tax=Streptantibioticus cattleyicolor (strain ATCC 35852 / DSM 46488 / JCM 4925 / NBRC 14057 / NRRL 8057) TaxID=1003195 RepID=G8X1C8_STREN|nr:hypothetical protein SCATT_57850 [Streptantibioticus cattleyicolor NRRL 8057 = DSM 46488]